MPIIYTYPKVTPALEDLVIISDASETNPAKATRQCTISEILAMGTGEDYDLNAGAKVGGYIPLNLTSTSGTDNSFVQFTEGSNITLTRNSSSQITIDSTDTNTTYTMASSTDGANVDLTLDASTGSDTTIQFTAGANMTITQSGGNEITFAAAGGGGAVSSVSAITPGASTGNPIVITPTTGAVEVKSMAFAGDVNVGHVPDASAAAATSYLKNDGTWATPPNTTSLEVENFAGAVQFIATDSTGIKFEGGTGINTTFNAGTYKVTNTLANTTVTAGSYTAADITVDAQGRLTAASNGTAGVIANGWDILNFAQGQAFTGPLAIAHFYQVVVPESFTANKAKIYVDVAGGGSYTVGIYSGVLSNLAAATKLGDGTVTPGADGIVEVALSPVSAGDLDLTKGQNVIMAFAQSAGSKLLCINGRLADANLAITATGIPPMPSTLNGMEEVATDALRPCCVLYQ